MAETASVLVIDDNAGVRRAFGHVLKREGFRVEMAEDGQSGLVALHDLTPDVVLLDLRMPGLDGLEVLSAAAREAPQTPVIVISGTEAVDDVVQALRRGAWDYVTKPVVDAHLLVQAVRRALERSSLLRENRQQKERLEQLNHQLAEAADELRLDQEAGRRTQFQLLPSDGLEIGDFVFHRRLFPSQYLSGDFVDYFAIGPNHAGFYLADVSGHGAASALVAAMLAMLVGRYCEAFTRGENDTVIWPDRLLEQLNRDLGLQRLRKHVTMFYGVIDLRAQRLTFSSAGQYPYPFFDDGNEVHTLECSGRPLGPFADARFSRREVSIAPTRRILLASDGALDLLPEEAGPPKLQRLARALRQTTNIDALAGELGIDPQARRTDDVTLLVVERRTSGHA